MLCRDGFYHYKSIETTSCQDTKAADGYLSSAIYPQTGSENPRKGHLGCSL